MKPADIELEILTTSVGRMLIETSYRSFLDQARFSGTFRFVVHVDPAYQVDRREREETLGFVRALPSLDRRVRSVTVVEQPRPVGLQRSLLTLFSHCRQRFGVHLEDDWRFFGELDLDSLLVDLVDQGSTLIGFNSTHVSARGTFERTDEVQHVEGSRMPLVRLVPPSWASDYLPLAPHLHDAWRWIPAYTQGMMRDDDPHRCPDERVRQYIMETGLRKQHNMMWTREVVCEDIGRAWLADRGLARQLAPAASEPAESDLPTSGQAVDGALNIRRSEALAVEARDQVPGFTQTFLKRPEHFAPGEYPIFLERGEGAVVVDVDGNRYIDYIAALGASAYGHAAPFLLEAIRQQAAAGILNSLPTRLELEAARLLRLTIPGAEKVRFLKTGADACSAAVRIARRITGRDGIASVGYHGWHDLFTAGTPGVPETISEHIHPFDLFAEDGEGSLEELLARSGDQIGCVLIALPYHRRVSRERLHAVARATRDHGALLVFDEIVTGFRLALGGAQEYFGVTADLVCLSKALAGGMPLSAICGPARTMDVMADLHISSTFGGETVSLACCIAVLGQLHSTDIVERIHKLGARLRDGLNELARSRGQDDFVVGYDPLPMLRFSPEPETHSWQARAFLAEMARRGILLRRELNFVTAAHDEKHIEFTLDAAAEALAAAPRRT